MDLQRFLTNLRDSRLLSGGPTPHGRARALQRASIAMMLWNHRLSLL